jgi:hypothetical protein
MRHRSGEVGRMAVEAQADRDGGKEFRCRHGGHATKDVSQM